MFVALSLSLERLTSFFGLRYVALFVAVIAFTTNGPDPTLRPADEMARALTEGDAMRSSALLGFAASLSFAAFAVCLTVLLARGGDVLGDP